MMFGFNCHDKGGGNMTLTDKMEMRQGCSFAKQIALHITTDYFLRHRWTMQRNAENNISEPRAELEPYNNVKAIIRDGTKFCMKTA